MVKNNARGSRVDDFLKGRGLKDSAGGGVLENNGNIVAKTQPNNLTTPRKRFVTEGNPKLIPFRKPWLAINMCS